MEVSDGQEKKNISKHESKAEMQFRTSVRGVRISSVAMLVEDIDFFSFF